MSAPCRNSWIFGARSRKRGWSFTIASVILWRSEEHTSELQSQFHLVCRLLLEKKKNTPSRYPPAPAPPPIPAQLSPPLTPSRATASSPPAIHLSRCGVCPGRASRDTTPSQLLS